MVRFLLGLLYHIVKLYQQIKKIGDLSREGEFYMVIYTKKAASSTFPIYDPFYHGGGGTAFFYGTGTLMGLLSVFRKFSSAMKGENNVFCFSHYIFQGDIFIHPVPAVI